MATNPLILLAQQEAERQGVDPALVLAVMQQESGGRADARSPKGAIGPMQLMPGTAADLGVDPADPVQNIRGGVAYLKRQLDNFKTPELALAAYNAGPGNVVKHGGVPPFPETQGYVTKIMAALNPEAAAGQQAPAPAGGGDPWQALTAKYSQGGAPAAGQSDPWSSLVQKYSQTEAPAAQAQPGGAPENPQAAPGAPSGPGNGLAARVWQGLTDPARGALQLLLRGAEKVTGPGGKTSDIRQSFEQTFADDNAAYTKNKSADQGGVDWGRLVGNLLFPVGGAGAAATKTLPALMASGARMGGMSGLLSEVDPAQQDNFWSEKGKQLLTGSIFGAGGGAFAKGVDKLAKPVTSSLNQTGQAAVQAAERLGVPLTAAQRTGSKGLQQIEGTLATLPGSAGVMAKVDQEAAGALNSAATKAIGQSGDEVTAGVLSQARSNLGNAFKNLSARTKVAMDADFINAVTKVGDENALVGATLRNPRVDKLVNEALEFAGSGNNVKLSGEAYQKIRARLYDEISAAYKSGHSDLGASLKGLRNALDASAKNGLSATEQKLWDRVRTEWSNLRVLERGKTAEGGNVSPAKLQQGFEQQMAIASKEGKLTGPLADVADTRHLFQTNPGSRVLQNLSMRAAPAALGGAGGAGYGAMTGDWGTGAAIGAATLGAPYAASKLYMSPFMQAWLAKGAKDLSPAVLSRMGGAAGIMPFQSLLDN